MWDKIANYFEKYPSQAKVARYLLKYGLRIDRDQVMCGDVQIADSAIARAAGVDRRVVKSTVETIKSDPALMRFFSQLLPTNHLKNAASAMGWSAIEIVAMNAHEPGIISAVAEILSKGNISIRQAIVDDPMTSEEPKLFIVTESQVPAELIPVIRQAKGVKGVTIY
ncbi:MAG: regulator [Candidatus Thermoplasmatota archaeon]|nr:regulator [Candidatus Thermoplasmatota archaeon]